MEYRVNNDFHALYDDADAYYLRRLSLYATVRPEDYKALKGNCGRPLGQKKSRNGLQSLQNLFCRPEISQSFVPDLQTSAIEEKDEQTPSTSSESLAETTDVLVHGNDIQDLPIEYRLPGMRTHELPVIGFYIDERVSPGFTYRVRCVGNERYVFGGKPRMLQSIGMGYGKRLTFLGDTLNHNDAYFWSDSHPEGFAFAIHAVSDCDRFSIYDATNAVVGELTVTKVDDAQVETKTQCSDVEVKKLVRVSFMCNVNLFHRHHNSLVEIDDYNNMLYVEGTAEVVKPKGSREANTTKIVDVVLPRIGSCSLWKEE